MSISQYSNYHGKGRRSNELRSAYRDMMRSLGKCLANNKSEFVVLLNESGVPAKDSDSYQSLIDKYVDNICHNQKLMLGTSLLLDMRCSKSSADGVDDNSVKDGYYTLRDYLSFDGDEEFSYLDPVTIGAISAGVGELSKLGTKALEGQQKKKYGALDMAQKKEEAKAALIQAVVQQKQQQVEAQKKKDEEAQKTKRTVIIVSSIVVGLAVVGVVALAIFKGKK